jgi:hypothetical protein
MHLAHDGDGLRRRLLQGHTHMGRQDVVSGDEDPPDHQSRIRRSEPSHFHGSAKNQGQRTRIGYARSLL